MVLGGPVFDGLWWAVMGFNEFVGKLVFLLFVKLFGGVGILTCGFMVVFLSFFIFWDVEGF